MILSIPERELGDRCPASGLSARRFKSQFCCLLAVWLWVNHVPSLDLCFPQGTVEIVVAPLSVVWYRWNGKQPTPLKNLIHCLSHSIDINVNLLSLWRWSQISVLGWTFRPPSLSTHHISPDVGSDYLQSNAFRIECVSFLSNPDLSPIFPFCQPPGFPVLNLCGSLSFPLSCAAFCQVLQIHPPQQLTRVLSSSSPWLLCSSQTLTASCVNTRAVF